MAFPVLSLDLFHVLFKSTLINSIKPEMMSYGQLWCSHLHVGVWTWWCCLSRWKHGRQGSILAFYDVLKCPIIYEVCFKIQGFGLGGLGIKRVPLVLLKCEYQLANLCNYAKHKIFFSVPYSWYTESYLISSSLHFCLRTGSYSFLIF